MDLTNAVNVNSTTEDTKLFKVYKDSATRKLKIGDVVVWTGLEFRHNNLTRNKPYVIVNTAYSSPEICVTDNSGFTNYYGRGAGFKVCYTKELRDSDKNDICIAKDNSLYLADDLSWLNITSSDNVLVLSDKQHRKRKFKNSKITMLEDKQNGYDFV